MLKFPRTLRLDPSDTFVFEHAAEPGEWAVTGAFLFWDADIPALSGKMRAAFRAGFLGLRSLGFSTLVVVSQASPGERDEAVLMLAQHLLTRFGAPNPEAARAAATEELDFAASLCQDPVGTVLAMRRTWEGGTIREQFRSLHPREPGAAGADRLHAVARAFEFVETDGEEEPQERVDLVALTTGGARGA